MTYQNKMCLARNPKVTSWCLPTGRMGEPPKDQQTLPNDLHNQRDKAAVVNSSAELGEKLFLYLTTNNSGIKI